MKLLSGLVGTWVLAVCVCACAVAQPPMEMTDSKPAPEFRNVAYGPHERNVFDLWKAKGEEPAPLVIFFHGGGFVGGDKWHLSAALLETAHEQGMAVASANYRFSQHAVAPASMLDGARCVQFIREHAADFGVDPARVALCGSSAGAGISMWIAFHDDLADSASPDAVARQSTRVNCVAVIGGQCSYNPKFIREVVGGRAWEHPALTKLIGIEPKDLDSEEAMRLFDAASAIPMLGKDDPPLYGWYIEDRAPLKPGPNAGPTLYYPQYGQPIPGADKPGQGIHHPNFGKYLKEKMDGLGIECTVRYRDDFPAGSAEETNARADRDMVTFFAKHFGLKTK